MAWTIHEGDALSVLRTLPADYFHTCVTSPPYWGLRAYKTQPVVWDDGWRGELGLEPDPALYVSHIVQIFREVRRVLRPDGTLWLNMGDCYITEPHSRDAEEPLRHGRSFRRDREPVGNLKHRHASMGLKGKDLVFMPARVAIALQADGWYLRRDIIWHKPNPMPESTADRCTSSHEYLFHFARSGDALYWTHRDGRGTRRRPKADLVWRHKLTRVEQREKPVVTEHYSRINLWTGHDYFYDQDAIREPHTYGDHPRNGVPGTIVQSPGQAVQVGITQRRSLGNRKTPRGWDTGPGDHRGMEGRYRPHPGGRGMPPQPNENPAEAFHPLGRNKRSVWTIPTQPYPEAHFATFPEDLVIPCVQAGSSAHGACAVCGAPWERVSTREFVPQPDVSAERGRRGYDGQKPMDESSRWDGHARGVTNRHHVGWQPTCECLPHRVVPCRVLDPFGGAATTGKVAVGLGRDVVLIELSPDYIPLAKERLSSVDAPLFNPRPEVKGNGPVSDSAPETVGGRQVSLPLGSTAERP